MARWAIFPAWALGRWWPDGPLGHLPDLGSWEDGLVWHFPSLGSWEDGPLGHLPKGSFLQLSAEKMQI
eukprot:10775644-Karenia_brevis.AAC.1